MARVEPGSADDQKWRRVLQKGEVVDALDTDKKWCLAEVINVAVKDGVPSVYIHYHGWDPKWDEWVKRDSDRLAPPRTKTTGDTTQAGWFKEREAQRRTVPAQPISANPANLQHTVAAPLDKSDLEFRRSLRVGVLCDVFYTPDQRWHLAEVVQENAEKIKARFHDMEHEEIVSRPSIRLSPPMTKSSTNAAPPVPPVQLQHAHPVATSAPSAPAGAAGVGEEPRVPRASGPVVQLDGNALKVGDLVDALDTEQKWRLAEILKVRPKDVFVRYIGWAPKWDEWIDRNSSNRLKPPRTFTDGDTGPRRKQPGPVMGYPGNMYQGGGGLYPQYQYPMPPPRPNYDCIGQCKWRRVMSSGVIGKELAALDSVMDKCCLLQDEFQDSLLSSHSSIFSAEFPQKLLALEEELNKLKTEFPSSSFHIDMCMRIVDGLKGTLKDSDTTARRQALAGTEDVYMASLQKNFHFIEIPADGNCLFAAARRGWGLFERLRKWEQDRPENAQGEDEALQRQLELLVREEQQMSKEHSLAASREFRHRAVDTIRVSPKYFPSIKSEVREAVLKHGQSGENATSKAIYAEMKKKFDNPLDGVDSEVALEAYLSVMGTDGIYGTIVEVEAISDSVQVPVNVYFRSNDKAEGPSKVIGSEFAGLPISLAFYMGQQHYKLLVPRQVPRASLVENESKGEQPQSHLDSKVESKVGLSVDKPAAESKWSTPAQAGPTKAGPKSPLPTTAGASMVSSLPSVGQTVGEAHHQEAPPAKAQEHPKQPDPHPKQQEPHASKSEQAVKSELSRPASTTDGHKPKDTRVIRVIVKGQRDVVLEMESHQRFAALIERFEGRQFVRERDNLIINKDMTPEGVDWKPNDTLRMAS